MKVLVTGGTGFVGQHLVPRLLAAGHEVRVLARRASPASLPNDVAVVAGDVVSGEGLDSALQGVAAVVHLVAVIRERGEYTFERVNHLGTANLISAMRQAGVLRLAHMSALGATPDPRWPYLRSKWLGEEAVRRGGVEWTILRPSVLFGRGAGFVRSLRSSAAPFPIFAPVPGSGEARFQPIWVEDVATCLLLALSDPRHLGQTYEVGGPEYLTYEEMLDLVLSRLRLRRIKVHVPLPVMRALAVLMARYLPNPPVTLAELAMLDANNTTDLDAVPKHFGFPPARMAEKIDS